MSARGKHASESSAGFYRDLATMILGIILVGAAVFFLLFLWAGGSADTTTTLPAAAPTTTTTTLVNTTPPDIDTTTTSTSTTTTTVPIRPPEDVRVAVVNSVGIAGAAGRLTQRLDEAGYQTLPPDDFQPEQDPSRIWFREGYSAEANMLLAFIPDAQVEPLPDDGLKEGADIVVVLGTGYQE